MEKIQALMHGFIHSHVWIQTDPHSQVKNTRRAQNVEWSRRTELQRCPVQSCKIERHQNQHFIKQNKYWLKTLSITSCDE